jgi:GT2 family glycosyltransferase
MKFSLVIPLAPERNAPIIESIKQLDYPKSEFHVVVVEGKNPSQNRNKGASKSKGDIIGFLDDDAVVDKSLLKKVEEFFEKYPRIDIVGGPQLTPRDDNYIAKISGYALSSKFGVGGISNRYKKGKLNLNADENDLTSANLFCKKEVLKEIQFDPKLFPGEDPKFISDAKKIGLKVAYFPEMIIYHKRRPTIKGLIKQVFNYGKVRPLKESFFETLKKPFFLVPSLFVLYLMGVFIITFFWKNIILFFPLILYISLNLIFSIIDLFNNKDYKAFLFLPFIYPIIHLSYGAGMIWGYLKKL